MRQQLSSISGLGFVLSASLSTINTVVHSVMGEISRNQYKLICRKEIRGIVSLLLYILEIRSVGLSQYLCECG